MIILPDRNVPRAKILMPVPDREWREPSQAQFKDEFGNAGIRTSFRLLACLHDGYIVWTGWFTDRADADAFMFALVSGALRYERDIWRLPTPEWHPGVSTELIYRLDTQTILTTTGSNQTYTSPADWTNASNTIECIGGAGSGGCFLGTGHATGGGGGAYSKISNFSFATPGTTTATYRVGSGGNGVSDTAGNAGSATWFNNASDPGAGSDNTKCSAAFGSGGARGTGVQNGGAGGASASGWGQTKYSGGRGGNFTGASGTGGTGGGGAAGPAGNGGDGGDTSSTSTGVRTAGGSANNGATAGGAVGAVGNDGTEWTTHGCGSGAGGTTGADAVTARNGGLYGGASGGSRANSGASGNGGIGRQGLIAVTYNIGSFSLANSNLPMMGM